MLINYLKRNLTAQIFLLTMALLCAACTLTYGFIAWFMPVTYTSALDAELEDQVQIILDDLQATTLEDSGPIWDYMTFNLDAAVELVDEAGQPVELPGTVQATEEAVSVYQIDSQQADSKAHVETAVEEVQSLYVSDVVTAMSDEAAAVSVAVSGSGMVLQMATKEYPFYFWNDPAVYTLRVTGSLQGVNQAVEALERILPWLALVVLVMATLSAWLCSRFIARPVGQLSAVAQRLSQLDFSGRCAEQRQDELGLLAHSLNTLAERLSEALEELRGANEKLQADMERERQQERRRLAFFSAVSHELKTPVTIIKGQLEGMQANVGVYQDRDTYLGRSLQVVNRLEQLVQEILTVSRMESPAFVLKRQPLDFTELVARECEAYAELAQLKRQTMILRLSPALLCRGDGNLLKKAVSNLLSNGVRYGPEGARLTVTLQKQDGWLQLAVHNSGAQLPPESLLHLFDAFYRIDPSRNRSTGGTGLGLYLVRMITELHCGHCQVENSGDGVLATLRLPAAPEGLEEQLDQTCGQKGSNALSK